ncbi:MAG: biotin/lipoyl-binding protein [Desulfovibrio sp.]|uniref:biotin/lipoyl-binding protein n=1 Tax=Desulfovibrio sp. TaxID=885 RepID=UPI0039E3C493
MSTPTPAAPQPLIPSSKRKFLMGVAAASFAVLFIGYGVYWFISARYDVSTDDAYVSGNVIQVSPQIAGTVIAVRADDTDYVQAGQPLVSIDDVDTRLALEQAKAIFSQTLREVRALYSNEGASVASVASQETNLARLQEDLARRQKLAGTGAVSAEELKHARDAVQTATDQVSSMRKQLEANQVLVDNTTLADHPRVKMAAARLREAYLAWRRTQVPAPVSGQVVRRSVQVGSAQPPVRR